MLADLLKIVGGPAELANEGGDRLLLQLANGMNQLAVALDSHKAKPVCLRLQAVSQVQCKHSSFKHDANLV